MEDVLVVNYKILRIFTNKMSLLSFLLFIVLFQGCSGVPVQPIPVCEPCPGPIECPPQTVCPEPITCSEPIICPSLDKIEQECFDDCKYYTNKFRTEFAN